MVKKLTVCVLIFIFTLSVSIYTFAETASSDATLTQQPAEENTPPQSGGRPQGDFGGQIPEGVVPQMPSGGRGGQIPAAGTADENAQAPQPPENADGNQSPQISGSSLPTGTMTSEMTQGSESSENTPSQETDESAEPLFGEENSRMPGIRAGAQNNETQTDSSFSGFLKAYSSPVISMVILALAFVFVIFYKRKKY